MKFSIRDLLLVTVIAALAIGWWLDHRRRNRRFFPDGRIVIEVKETDLPLYLAPAHNPPKK